MHTKPALAQAQGLHIPTRALADLGGHALNLVLTLVLCLAAPWPALAQALRPTAPVVAPAVEAAVQAGQSVEALVVLDDQHEKALQSATEPVSQPPLHRLKADAYNQKIAVRQALLATMKEAALNALAGPDLIVLRDYSHLPMLHVRLSSAAALQRLAAHPRVLRVDEVKVFVPKGRVQFPPPGHLPKAVAASHQGAGTSVVVLDSPVDYTLPEFGSCTAPGGSCKVAVAMGFGVAYDLSGYFGEFGSHGTKVARVVLQRAPATRIIAVVREGPNPVIDTVNWAVANKARYNIAAINMSFGDRDPIYRHPVAPVDALGRAIATAVEAGIVVAAASGNEHAPQKLILPAAYSNVVSVGATTGLGPGQVTEYSNSSYFLSMLAYARYAGTSFSTPDVSGAVAILREAFPTASAEQLVARLKRGPLLVDHRVPGGVRRTPFLDMAAALSTDFKLQASEVSVLEGDTSVTLTVTRSPADGEASVRFATADGTAKAGTDYTDSNGLLNFADGVATAQLTVPITRPNNSTFDGDTSFTVALSPASTNTVVIAPGSTRVTIQDDEPPVGVSFGSASVSVSEGARTLTLPVTRTQSAGSASVAYATSAGTAKAGADYMQRSGTLNFANGVSRANITLYITDNKVKDGNRTFVVDLSKGVRLRPAGPSRVTVTIVDND